MKGFRISKVDGAELSIPTPINISELVGAKKFFSPIIHFSDRQWDLTVSNLELVKNVPEDAVVMKAFRLAGGYGVTANPFFRCPPGCEPSYGRELVCSDVVEAGFVPDPNCYFEPLCTCDDEVDPGGEEGDDRPSGCKNSECHLHFAPVQEKVGVGLTITMMRMKCANSGSCLKCKLVRGKSAGSDVVACICEDC